MSWSVDARPVAPSATVAMADKVRRLAAQGRDIVSLAVGEPAFGAPEAVVGATCRALVAGESRYGPVGGLPELRDRLARQLKQPGPDNILITNGAKQALYTLFQVLIRPGDEVILPRPCWVSFEHQIRLAGGTVTAVDLPDHRLDPESLAAAVTPRTRAILINSPNNPTGAVFDPAALEAVAALAAERDLLLIADEAYIDFFFDGQAPVCLAVLPDAADRTVTIRSFSKSYGLTGFRVGYAAGPERVIAAMAAVQSHSTGNVCTFAQHGALAAMDLPESWLAERRREMAANRDLALDLARQWFDCIRPQGAFYLFPDVRRHLGRGETAADFTLRLLETAGVALVPGEAFGRPGCVRISFSVPAERITAAFDRLGGVL